MEITLKQAIVWHNTSLEMLKGTAVSVCNIVGAVMDSGCVVPN